MRAVQLVLLALPLPALGWLVCDPLAHGAKGNGLVYDTDAVRAAVDECGSAGGGTVVFAAGMTFLTGSFNVSSNTELRVDGTILGSPNATGYVLMDYLNWYGPDAPQKVFRDAAGLPADTREWSPFIGSWYQSGNISITGSGTIDGAGESWWQCADNMTRAPCSGYPRPHGVRFVGGENYTISGVTIQNSPMWQVHLSWLTNAHVHDVRILAPAQEGHNTDGIDPDCAQNVLIERVYISTGDDCIAIKSGRNWFGREFGRTAKNITVRDSVFGTGHGLSVGSEMSGGVADVLFYNITANGISAGPRLKSERGRGGLVTNVTWRDITLVNAGQAVQVTDNYDPGLPPTNATATPRFENISVIGLHSSNASSGWFLDGLPESPIKGLSLQDVVIDGTDARNLIKKCDFVDTATATCTNVSPSCPPCVTRARA
jgi:polygalacturonase